MSNLKVQVDIDTLELYQEFLQAVSEFINDERIPFEAVKELHYKTEMIQAKFKKAKSGGTNE
jgi:hypothetical protein